MNIEPILYVTSTLVSLLVLFFIIRYAVELGMTAALRRHEAWMRDGSLEGFLDAHAARLAERAEQREADRRQLGEERAP